MIPDSVEAVSISNTDTIALYDTVVVFDPAFGLDTGIVVGIDPYDGDLEAAMVWVDTEQHGILGYGTWDVRKY